MRSADLRRSRVRLRVAEGFLLLAFLGLGARAAHLSLFDSRATQRGEDQVFSVLRLAPLRGLIVDRHGVELALSTEAPSVYAIPSVIEDHEKTAAALARTLRLDARRLAGALRSRHPFVYLARWVSERQAEKVRKLKLAGIGVVPEPRRSYPYERLAATLIGFANIDGKGVRGVEQLEDGWLRGAWQRVAVERDGRRRMLVGPGLDPHRNAGGDVALSLDIAFQIDAESALQDALEASGARGGFVICLDPHSGEVLALAEQPTFDPNRFRSVPYTSTRSRVFLDAFEPGSTLKPFLMAAALEAEAVAPGDVIELEGGVLRVSGKSIRDLHPRESLDVAGILRVSSNVGAVKIAQRLGPRTHFEMLKHFGFGSSTRSGFPEESAGLLRSWQAWKPIDQATIAFGQGIGVTAIQMAAATAALANGGTWRAPRLRVARRRPGGVWERHPQEDTGRRVVSNATAARLLAMMQGVVASGGTGRRAALEGIRVAGKTGTAQKLDPDTGSYAKDRFVAWFAGLAPAGAPKVVVVVGLDEPRRPTHTGGAVAAPLFARVAAAHLTRLGLPTRALHGMATGKRAPRDVRRAARRAPDRSPGRPATAAVPPSSAAKAAARPKPVPELPSGPAAAKAIVQLGARTLLPDFRGLSVAEVRRLTEGTPLVLELSGAGLAVAQEPEPGTILAGKVQRVRVRFASEQEG
jgi:cell division protein FtsI (penicillin-binding protein 3)